VRVTPTLDEVAADPTLVSELSPQICAALATTAAAVVVTLSGRMVMASAASGNSEARGTSQLLNIPTVAKLLDVPQSFAYELARRGDLPTVKVGSKYVRVRVDDLDAWIARHRNESSATMHASSRKRGGR
jgi:excisionase family DNA binding protein